ncbi:MAG TPA: GH3 auxin-responsive promoter family protein [Thermoanaerobaculia bacterium]|nr:GH3 auxin-responsive promoter family protein [Thermoanaerobaculia bacterium]
MSLPGLLWITANAGGWRRFRTALKNPEKVQAALLRGYLRRNAETAFGKAHGFSAIRSVQEFQDRVPLAGYAEMEPWITRVAAGEKAVLTRSPVRTLEVTSGSSAAAKRIPYTAEMQVEIRRAVAPWVFDLYKDRPRLALGSSYWSITPLEMAEEKDGGAVKVGFEEDAEYLGGFWKRLVDSTLAVPGSVRFLRDVAAFRYATLLFLLRRPDLALISVWHPSFLILLMRSLPGFWADLLRDLESGTEIAERNLRPQPRRAAELRRLAPDALTRIWPRLGLISCWGDAHAALHLDEVRRAFPGVEIQPKGLLATEAFVTLPFAGKAPLAIRSHFFEFLAEGAERPRLAHELVPGEVYSIMATTGGGLYRYRLEDRVEVTGFAERTPSLRFLGREGHVSDLRGEKLHESFVAGALVRAFRKLGVAPRFALLAPEDEEDEAPRYVLFVESREPVPPGLAPAVEEELAANPHYRACVALGQLAPAAVFAVEGEAFPHYLERCRERGQRLGDVKPLALSAESGWGGVFPGRTVRRDERDGRDSKDEQQERLNRDPFSR